MHENKHARVWSRIGGGDPPLIWTLAYWPDAHREAKFLTAQQYWHEADQLMELAREPDPCRCETVDVAPIEDFWELKDKGGPLGKINLRIFFLVHSERREIVVLGVHKKEDEGQLRRSVVVRISRRKRLYLQSIAKKE